MRQIPISELKLDMAVFPRVEINDQHVHTLMEVVEAGIELPPILVCSETLRVVDGFHRYSAYFRVHGLNHVVQVIEKRYENDRALFLDSIRLNAGHGMPLSAADRQSCALIASRFGIASSELAVSLSIREASASRLMSTVKPSDKLVTERKSFFRPISTNDVDKDDDDRSETAMLRNRIVDAALRYYDAMDEGIADQAFEELVEALRKYRVIHPTKVVA